jgi:hypothetical protein
MMIEKNAKVDSQKKSLEQIQATKVSQIAARKKNF